LTLIGSAHIDARAWRWLWSQKAGAWHSRPRRRLPLLARRKKDAWDFDADMGDEVVSLWRRIANIPLPRKPHASTPDSLRSPLCAARIRPRIPSRRVVRRRAADEVREYDRHYASWIFSILRNKYKLD
jgi:hypothetical protein